MHPGAIDYSTKPEVWTRINSIDVSFMSASAQEAVDHLQLLENQFGTSRTTIKSINLLHREKGGYDVKATLWVEEKA